MELTRLQYLRLARISYCLSCSKANLITDSKGKLSVGCKKQRECERLLLFEDNYKKATLGRINTENGTKACRICHNEKPLKDFPFRNRNKDKHGFDCKSCIVKKEPYRPNESEKIARKSRLLTRLKEEREVEALFHRTDRLFDQKDFNLFKRRVRYKLDDEFRQRCDKHDKLRRSDPRYAYLAKKYLKRYLAKLEKHEAIILEIENMPEENITYKLKVKLERYKRLREVVIENIRIAREGIELRGESEFYKSRQSMKEKDNTKQE